MGVGSTRWLFGARRCRGLRYHYLQEPYNPGFIRFPTIVALHVILGGVYLMLAPLKFVKRIRSRQIG